MTRTIRRLSSIALAAILLLATAASAQDSKSATSVTELVKMLDSMKLDSFAVKGASPNEYVGALYFPGSQLLVVSAKFDTPWRADSLLEMKNYRDLYIELNSASVPQSRSSSRSHERIAVEEGRHHLRYGRHRRQDVQLRWRLEEGEITADDYTRHYRQPTSSTQMI
jgi:hypothetical protein